MTTEIKEVRSRLRFLKTQRRWLKQDLRDTNVYKERTEISKYLSDNQKEIDILKSKL